MRNRQQTAQRKSVNRNQQNILLILMKFERKEDDEEIKEISEEFIEGNGNRAVERHGSSCGLCQMDR